MPAPRSAWLVPPEIPDGSADDLRGRSTYRLPAGGLVAEHEVLRGYRQRGVQVVGRGARRAGKPRHSSRRTAARRNAPPRSAARPRTPPGWARGRRSSSYPGTSQAPAGHPRDGPRGSGRCGRPRTRAGPSPARRGGSAGPVAGASPGYWVVNGSVISSAHSHSSAHSGPVCHGSGRLSIQRCSSMTVASPSSGLSDGAVAARPGPVHGSRGP